MKDKFKKDLGICKSCEKYHEYGHVYRVDADGNVVHRGGEGTHPFHCTFRKCDCDEAIVALQTNWGEMDVPDDCPFLTEHKMKEWNKGEATGERHD